MSYETQAGTAVYTEAQKRFWDDQALTIADMFESVYDDIVDEMIVTSVKITEDYGYFSGSYPEYCLAEDNSFLVAEIDIRYDFTKDGLIYSYESWTVVDFNGDKYADMDELRERAKLISVRPSEEVSSIISYPQITESRLTA